MSTARTSISLPAEVYARAQARMRALGYRSFSSYIEHLIRTDTIRGGAHLREESANYPATSHQAAADVVAGAIGDVSPAATTAPQPPTDKVRYKVPRPSKKRPPA